MPTAIVTGSSRGIGRGIIVCLAQDGWSVVVNYCGNKQAAEDTCAAVEQAGGKAIAVQGDVAITADRERLVAESLAWNGSIDLLVNNAGIAPSVRADILDAGEESFDRLMTVNLKGPYFLTQLVAKQMIAQEGKGQIINISSISAYTASVNRGDYCLSKSGLGMMTALYAARLADEGIRVYEVRPVLSPPI